MKLTPNDVKAVGQLFEDKNNAGYVLDFTDKTMREFFESEFSIDIDNDLYRDDGGSKLKRLRCFVKKTERGTVLKVVTRLWEYRKTLNEHPISAQDESIYGRLILKIQGADSHTALVSPLP